MSKNQKISQYVVIPGAKFDRNQVASQIGLFNPDGTEFEGATGESVIGGGWQASPPYQNMVMKVSDIADLELSILTNANPLTLPSGAHLYAYDGSNAKVYTSTGENLPMEINEDIQPTLDDVFFSNVFVDATSDPNVQSNGIRIWYNDNTDGISAPRYWVVEGEIKQASDTNLDLFVKDLCNVDASDDIIVSCVVNENQPSNTFYFNRVDSGIYNATLSGLTINGEVSPEIPFGYSVLKDLVGDGSGYRWVQGGAGLSTAVSGIASGTTPGSVEFVGSDLAGVVTFTTGSDCVVGELFEVTLGNPIPTKYVVEISAANEASLAVIDRLICSTDLVDGETWSISVVDIPLDDAVEYSLFYSIHKFYN